MYNISHVEFTINNTKWSYAIYATCLLGQKVLWPLWMRIFYVIYLFHLCWPQSSFGSWSKWLNVHKSSKNKESYLKTHMPLTLYRDYHMPTNGRQTVIWKQWVWHAIAHLEWSVVHFFLRGFHFSDLIRYIYRVRHV